MDNGLGYDQIGPWSEVKLDIVRGYASAYSQILSAQGVFSHVYIDAFAGAGLHLSRTTGDYVAGSPLNALNVDPKFAEYYFIDLDRRKVDSLREIAAKRDDVHIFEGDCNQILLSEVFPKVRYEQYRRGLCLLDPYGLHLKWETIKAAADTRAVEVFLNFPIMDMNRNALRRNPDLVTHAQAARLTSFWGDESWREAAYVPGRGLFPELEEKESNEVVAEAFQCRLRTEAGFSCVPDPLPMRNIAGATVYYLFFASHKAVAGNIVDDIFRKYRERGVR